MELGRRVTPRLLCIGTSPECLVSAGALEGPHTAGLCVLVTWEGTNSTGNPSSRRVRLTAQRQEEAADEVFLNGSSDYHPVVFRGFQVTAPLSQGGSFVPNYHSSHLSMLGCLIKYHKPADTKTSEIYFSQF